MIAHNDPIEHLGLAAMLCLLVALRAELLARSPSHGRAERRSAIAFAAGMAAVLAALSPPAEAIADRSYTGHMIQHLGLIVVAGPLVALGLPTLPARRGHRQLARRARAIGRWSPLLATGAFVVVIAATHLTDLYEEALVSRWVHDLEHLAYLLSAVWLWHSLVRHRRAGTAVRLVCVFGLIAATALVGAVLMSSSEPLVAHYAAQMGTTAALDDQRRAAALMWVTGMLTSLPLLVWAVWSYAATEQRRAELAEAARDRGPSEPAPVSSR